jgi:carboxyl-terminal processing protease
MRRTSWPWLAAAVLAAAACFFLLSGRILPGASDRETGDRGFQLLGTVIQLIKHDYVDEPSPAKTMDGAFRGLVDSLDILSTYLVPADALKYQDSQKTVYQDSGVVLLKAFGGFPQVVGLVDNSPAAPSGLKPGDAISSINGRSTFGLSLVETQLALKSRGNETAKIKVLRQARTMDLTLGRALPVGLPVSFTAAKGTAGILRIRRIAAPCAVEARAVLNSRLRANSGPLVLDLRNCSEGDPEEARRLLNLFLQADRIGSFLKRQGGSEILSCPQTPKWKSVPLAVWTNLGTQGAAELVAGVLQDFRRAKVIGLETPGLAAKTQFLSLPDGSALLLTTGVFALNSGKKIWGAGVKPDGEIDIRDDSPNSYLKKTVSLLSSR